MNFATRQKHSDTFRKKRKIKPRILAQKWPMKTWARWLDIPNGL